MRPYVTFIAIALAATLLVNVAASQAPIRDDPAIGRIRNLGGFVSLDDDGRPTHASIKQFPPSEFELLSKLHGLKSLDVGRCELGNVELAAICEIASLQSLSISNGDFSHAGLRKLADLKSLSILRIDASEIALKAGEDSLAKLPDSLQGLRIRDCKIDDGVLRAIVGSKRLQSLEISNSQLNDKRLAILKPMSELRVLAIPDQPEISDEALDTLTWLSNLRHLDISQTTITDDGQFTLQMALPKCLIIRVK